MYPNKPTHEYVATAKCGCVVALIAVIPGEEKETAKEVSSLIRSGCTIELIERESDNFKQAVKTFGHHCLPVPLTLF
jgi:hypothetical protein